MVERKTASLLSGATGALLLGSVVLRLIEDAPLFASVGSDPLALGLLAVEVVLLGIAALLGIASVYIGRMIWTGRMRSRLLPAIVFGIILVGGLFAVRGGGMGAVLGAVLALLSGAALFFDFRLPRTSQA